MSALSLSESESIAFSGVWKILGLLLVLRGTNATSEVFFSNKVDENLRACNQGLREGDTKGTSYPGKVATRA